MNQQRVWMEFAKEVILAAEPSSASEKKLAYQCQTKNVNRLVHLQWIKDEKQPTRAELQQIRQNNPRINFTPPNFNSQDAGEQQQVPNDYPNPQR